MTYHFVDIEAEPRDVKLRREEFHARFAVPAVAVLKAQCEGLKAIPLELPKGVEFAYHPDEFPEARIMAAFDVYSGRVIVQADAITQ